jgi:hypothetical protein
MAEYLLLFRGGDSGWKDDPASYQAHMEKWMQWMGALSEQGKFVGAQPLKSEGKVVNGKSKVVTDGPFIEGKELVGGYLICRAGSFEEAVEISKGCPILENEGTVEVREIQEMKM